MPSFLVLVSVLRGAFRRKCACIHLLISPSYVLFSIGNLTPLFQAVWPACWKKETVCDTQWINAVTYLEIVGIIVGQMLVGYLGDS